MNYFSFKREGLLRGSLLVLLFFFSLGTSGCEDEEDTSLGSAYEMLVETKPLISDPVVAKTTTIVVVSKPDPDNVFDDENGSGKEEVDTNPGPGDGSGGVPPPIKEAQEIINDNPVLYDNVDSYDWWKPPADIDRLGYKSNGFHFTLAIGNEADSSFDSWARWDFDAVHGRYIVEAYIPANWATAHVQYLISVDQDDDGIFTSDEYVDGPWLNQELISGWQTLDTYDLDGAVRVEVHDSRARDDYRDVGPVYARLAADALRLLEVSDGSGTVEPNTTSPDEKEEEVDTDSGDGSGTVEPNTTSPEEKEEEVDTDSGDGSGTVEPNTTSPDEGGEVSSPIEEAQEIINDNPVLYDNVDSYDWWKPPADIDRLGYESNGFHFTLAIGNEADSSFDSWARWDFDAVHGRYVVQAYIPANWATAHVQYLISVDQDDDGIFTSDEYVDGPWLNQELISGWQTLDTYDLDGAVRVEVHDSRTRDDYRDVGPVYARLAADALRLLEVSD